MKSFSRPTWMPLAVFASCIFGTLALAQPPIGRQPAGPPPGFGPQPGNAAGNNPGYPPPGVQPPRQQPGNAAGNNPGYPPPGMQPPGGAGGPPPGFGPQPGNANPGEFPRTPGAGMQPPPGMMPGMANAGLPNAGMPNIPNTVIQNEGKCSKCNKTVTWTGNNPPNSCPHCSTKFGFVENADGSKTYTSYGRTSSVKWIIIGVIVAISVVAAIVRGIMAAAGGGSKKKVKKRKKPMRRPRDDDDDY